MARFGMVVMLAALAMVVVVATGVGAAESVPNCDTAASSLLPCYPYVTGPDAKPPTECCGGLSSLNTNSPTCLCQLITQLNGSASSEPSVNITKALNLPRDCAITLKTSDCPALASLPLAPPAGVTTPTPAAPATTTSPGPSAAPGPGSGLPHNRGWKPVPIAWATSGVAGVVVLAQAFVLF